MNKKNVFAITRAIVSIALIIILLKTQDVKRIKGAILGFNLFVLGIGVALNLLGTYFSVLRWQTILLASKRKVNLKFLYKLYLKAYFYNNFMPTQMGGDFYKSFTLGRKIGNRTEDQATAMFSVFADRFSGVIILVLISILGVGAIFGLTGIVMALGSLIILLIAYNPGINIFIKLSPVKVLTNFTVKFKEASDFALRNKQLAIKTLFYAFLVQLCSFAWTYVFFVGLGIKIPVAYVLAYFPLVSLSLALPISFNGLGSQELIYAFLFSTIGVGKAVSITVSVLTQVQRLIMSLLGGILVLTKQ